MTILPSEAPQQPPQIEPFTYTPRVYIRVPDMLEIHHNRVVSGVAPLGFPRFTTPMPPTVVGHVGDRDIVASGEVTLRAKTLAEAFAMIPDVMKAAIEELKSRARGAIVVPKGGRFEVAPESWPLPKPDFHAGRDGQKR